MLRQLHFMVTQCLWMLLLILSTPESNPGAITVYSGFVGLLCVAPSAGLTGDDHHTRWGRAKWAEYSGGEIRMTLSDKILVFPQCSQEEAQSFRLGGHRSGYKSPAEQGRLMTNWRGAQGSPLFIPEKQQREHRAA